MNEWQVAPWLLKIGGQLLLFVGLGAATYLLVMRRDGQLRIRWIRYESRMRAQFRALFLTMSGEAFARLQLSCALLGTLALLGYLGFTDALAELSGWAPLLVLHLSVWGAPRLWLKWTRKRRTKKLEEQAHKWLKMMSDTLQVTPALGQALETTLSRLKAPISQEVGLIVKEMKLGLPADDAIRAAALRIDSRVFRASTVALIVANRSGGNISETLKRTSDELREGLRLERMLKARTADFRNEIIILGGLYPAVLVGMRLYLPKLSAPLFESGPGMVYLAGTFAAWAFSVLWTRQVLQVTL